MTDKSRKEGKRDGGSQAVYLTEKGGFLKMKAQLDV